MRTYDIALEKGEVQLRLTIAKLQKFLEKTGSADMAPLLGVLDAINNLDKKIQLLTAALTWAGNPNKNVTLDGAELLDLLVDEGMTARDVDGVILELTQTAGLIDEAQREELTEALDMGREVLFDTICNGLAGKGLGSTEAGPAEAPENPTMETGSGG